MTKGEKNRAQKLLKRYGITMDQYNTLLYQQDGVCAICGRPCRINKNLSVDHDHRTNEVRGLLCDDCNNGLERFKDDPDLLRKAIEYLNGEKPTLL